MKEGMRPSQQTRLKAVEKGFRCAAPSLANYGQVLPEKPGKGKPFLPINDAVVKTDTILCSIPMYSYRLDMMMQIFACTYCLQTARYIEQQRAIVHESLLCLCH